MTIGLTLFIVLLCSSFIGYQHEQDVKAANTQAELALVALRDYKIDALLNRDPNQRRILKEKAEAAYTLAPTARSSAVYALATVWEQGWQDSGKLWRPDDFSAAQL